MPSSRNPLVSVVIPTYDRPKFLSEAIESVLDQTYRNVELIIVDDCSPRSAADAVDALAVDSLQAFELVRHERNRGGAAARNTGIEAANGEYIAFLDDDDKWDEAKLGTQVRTFERSPDNVGLVSVGGRSIDQSGNIVHVSRPTHSGNITKDLLCRNVLGSFSLCMVRTSIIDNVGTLDERFPSWQDQEWYIRVSQQYAVRSIPEPLVTYRRSSKGRITGDVELTVNETYPLFVAKYGPTASDYGRLFCRKMRAWASFRVGKLLIDSMEYQRARQYFIDAVRLYPAILHFYPYLLSTLGGRTTYAWAARARREFTERFQ